ALLSLCLTFAQCLLLRELAARNRTQELLYFSGWRYFSQLPRPLAQEGLERVFLGSWCGLWCSLRRCALPGCHLQLCARDNLRGSQLARALHLWRREGFLLHGGGVSGLCAIPGKTLRASVRSVHPAADQCATHRADWHVLELAALRVNLRVISRVEVREPLLISLLAYVLGNVLSDLARHGTHCTAERRLAAQHLCRSDHAFGSGVALSLFAGCPGFARFTVALPPSLHHPGCRRAKSR